MRLYAAKIPALAQEIVKALTVSGDVEAESPGEVVKDVESVLSNYINMEREVADRAKEMMRQRNLPQREFGRIRGLVAEQMGIKVGDDMLDFLLQQLVEMLWHSNNVDEVFVEDHDLRRRIRPALRKHLELEQQLDQEVRGQLKHVQEGSSTWEIEYRRIMGDIQRRKGLS